MSAETSKGPQIPTFPSSSEQLTSLRTFSAPTWPGGHHPADPEAGESVANYNSADGEPSRLRKSAMTNDLISA